MSDGIRFVTDPTARGRTARTHLWRCGTDTLCGKPASTFILSETPRLKVCKVCIEEMGHLDASLPVTIPPLRMKNHRHLDR
jgi:hypothetical protein